MSAQRIQHILEVPYFYFVIIAAAGEHASRRMKINGTHWSIMLFKSIKQRANSVIPKLDCTTDCYQCLELTGIAERGAITCADCKAAKVVLDGRKHPSRDSTSTQTSSASQQPWLIQRMQQRRRTQASWSAEADGRCAWHFLKTTGDLSGSFEISYLRSPKPFSTYNKAILRGWA